MIIKGITETFLSQNWKELLVELLIVIVGVFLPIQIGDFYRYTKGFSEVFFDNVTLERRDIEQHIIDHYGIGRWLYHLHPEALEGTGFDEEDKVLTTSVSRKELETLIMRVWHSAYDFRSNMEDAMEVAREIEENIAAELAHFD